jgi:hypothetical protein
MAVVLVNPPGKRVSYIKTIRHTSFGRLTLFLALIFFSLSVVPSEALALSPTDLVIVNNLTVPESEAVASYCAKKRGYLALTLSAWMSPQLRGCFGQTLNND